MRDLTKALHHLRSYLPPSVAPAGQTLTKIETLRLTIRYISYLSAQLGLSEEVLFQRRERADTSVSETSSPDILCYFQSPSIGGQATQVQSPNLIQSGLYAAPRYSQTTALHSENCSFGVDQHSEAPQHEDTSLDAVLQTPPVPQPSCQVSEYHISRTIQHSVFVKPHILHVLDNNTPPAAFSHRCVAKTSAPRSFRGSIGVEHHHHMTIIQQQTRTSPCLLPHCESSYLFEIIFYLLFIFYSEIVHVNIDMTNSYFSIFYL